jgi:hypothetical protein
MDLSSGQGQWRNLVGYMPANQLFAGKSGNTVFSAQGRI